MTSSPHLLDSYVSSSGTFESVWTLEIQTQPGETDRILDAVIAVHPLAYGRYERNASITATGIETSRPPDGTTTSTHSPGFVPGDTENYPMVELKISFPRDIELLQKIMEAVLYVHAYEEPVVFLREDWTSKAAYNPSNDNPNRWWNNGRGLPDRIQ